MWNLIIFLELILPQKAEIGGLHGEQDLFFSVLAYNYGIPVSLSVNAKQIVCQEDALARRTNANVLKMQMYQLC
jgi:hypothetical protein